MSRDVPVDLPAEPYALATRAADITTRPLDPVWDGLLWAGKPTLVAGDPGLGKSMVTCDIAARVSTGAPWPCSTEHREPAEVVMLSAEDDPEDTIVPRLMAAGAALERVTFVRGIMEPGKPGDDGPRQRWLSLDRHLDELAEVLRERDGDVRLLIVDPLSAYLGRDCDSHNEGDVRSVLAGLAELATAHRAAVLCVRHLRKSESTSAQQRIIGSIAFTAAARAVYIVARDPADEDRRLLLCAKNNLAPDSAGYGYIIRADDERTPYVQWDDEREMRTADEVLGAAPDRTHVVDVAEAWIAETLADGPLPSRRMRNMAGDAGHSWRTVERARVKMGGIIIERIGGSGSRGAGAWQWRLISPPSLSPPSPAPDVGGLNRGRANTGLQGDSRIKAVTPPSTRARDGHGARNGSCSRCAGEGCRWCGR